MSDRFVVGVPLGRWQTNCYVVGDHDRGKAVVIDPGEHGEEQVPALLQRLDVEVEAILLTHGHLDHIWAVPGLADHLDVPVLLHPDDRWLWDDPAAAFGAPPELLHRQLGLPAWDPPTDRLADLDVVVASYGQGNATMWRCPYHGYTYANSCDRYANTNFHAYDNIHTNRHSN